MHRHDQASAKRGPHPKEIPLSAPLCPKCQRPMRFVGRQMASGISGNQAMESFVCEHWTRNSVGDRVATGCKEEKTRFVSARKPPRDLSAARGKEASLIAALQHLPDSDFEEFERVVAKIKVLKQKRADDELRKLRGWIRTSDFSLMIQALLIELAGGRSE